MGSLEGDDDFVFDAASLNADNDDNDGNNDDDGVTLGGTGLQNAGIATGSTITLDIATNGASDGLLNAWIDFNQDGDFLDAGEQIATDVAGTTGDSISLVVNVPTGSVVGDTFARFRYSTASGLTPFDDVATGVSAIDGEVEDYKIKLNNASMSVSKVSTPQNTPLLPGDTIDYTIQITNTAPSGVLNNIIVNDALSAGTTLNGICNISGWTYVTKAATDDFSSGDFVGGTNWSSNWIEIGESDGSASGDIIITSNRLRVQDNDNGGEGVRRTVDFTGYGTTAALTFDYQRDSLNNAGDSVTISVSIDGGAWVDIVTIVIRLMMQYHLILHKISL